MSTFIPLETNEQKLFDKLKSNIKKLQNSRDFSDDIDSNSISHEETMQLIDENAEICTELHAMLKNRGHTPIHYKYMIKNRGTITADSFEFYRHLHPQEDLLQFIENPNRRLIGTDPDVTMGEKFTFKVYSKRWGHDDRYDITRNADGWYVTHLGINGQCDHEGNPILYKNLDQDFIAHCKDDVQGLMGSIWSRAEDGESKDKIQDYLNQIAKWISTCEKEKPEGINV